MKTHAIEVHSGHILEEQPSMTLAELCRNCQASAETVIRLIEHGIISPCEGDTSRQWRFQQTSLIRTHKALRLKQDLGINLAGIALTMELLDEIDTLKKELDLIKKTQQFF